MNSDVNVDIAVVVQKVSKLLVAFGQKLICPENYTIWTIRMFISIRSSPIPRRLA